MFYELGIGIYRVQVVPISGNTLRREGSSDGFETNNVLNHADRAILRYALDASENGPIESRQRGFVLPPGLPSDSQSLMGEQTMKAISRTISSGRDVIGRSGEAGAAIPHLVGV
jgi:hypothetical protein